MLFCAVMLLSLYVATAHSQDFVCGYGLGGDEVTAAAAKEIASSLRSSSTDPIYVLPLFGKFKDQDDPITLNKLKDRDGKETQSSENLLDLDHKGSLAHFFYEMSYGALSLAIHESDRHMLGTWLESKSEDRNPYFGKTSTNPATEADCHTPRSGKSPIKLGEWRKALITFSAEIFEDADRTVDFNNYDSDGDGRVSLVVAVFNPVGFSELCGPNGTVFFPSYTTNDPIGGDPSRANITVNARVIIGDHSKSFPYLVGLMAHEYGHALNLPELYDRTNLFEPSADYDDHSAGIGYYGSMGKGNNGYATKRPGVVDGPAPLSEWSRIEMDWITEQTLANPDGRLVKVGADMDLSIHDINSPSGKVYKIEAPYSSDEYFLLANRQNTYDGTANKGSYYDEYAPARGLLIYHVDENVNPSSPYSRINDVNAYEEHKAVDVECADGLRRDQATSTADPVNFIDDDEAGGDDLDYWTGANDQAGKDYRKSRRGNIGDAADMWTSTSGDFTPFTIPSTDGYDNMGTSSDYTDDEQTKFTGIVIRGITQNWDGLVAVEIRFIPSEPVVYFGSLSQGTGTDWYKVTLKWSAPEVNNTDIDRYEYSSNGAAWMGFAAVTEDTDTGVFTGTIELPTEEETVKYPFQVQAVTNSGEAGMPSAEVRFTLDRPGSISLSSYQPTVGDELEATPTDPNMLESDWDSDVSWQWQRRGVGETTWTGANDIPEATEASYMLTGDDKDMEVRATVAYDDEVGPDDEDTAASAPTASVVGPELVGPESLTFVEHGEEVVPTYTVSGVADGTATWSFSGPDKERFDRPEPSARSSQWQLHFLEPPNYEDARDHGGDNTYHVTIEATPTAGASSENSLADFMAAFQGSSDEDAAAQAATLTKEVIVEVIDGDDLGVVTLLPEGPPRVGKELTAVLEEEDGALPGTTAWTWKSSESIQGPWTDVSGVPLATAAVGTFVPYPELAGGRKMSTAGWSKSKVAYKRQLLTSAYRGRADHECWANAEWVVLVF